MANRPSPNWQESHTTYIPLIVLAEPGGLYATYHLLREPETTVELYPETNMASWKIPIFNTEYIFNRSIFHGHVSLSEGMYPETNSSPLKMDGWKMKIINFLSGWPIFRGGLLVSGSVPTNKHAPMKKSKMHSLRPQKKPKIHRPLANLFL